MLLPQDRQFIHDNVGLKLGLQTRQKMLYSLIAKEDSWTVKLLERLAYCDLAGNVKIYCV